MNNTPKISIIMSVYNGEEYLSEAIDSVIKQTFIDWELIVINDCSTDTTPEILMKYQALDERIKIYTNEVNLRLPSSLNKALSLANGKYIARLDADDICLPNRLEMQYEFMEKNSDIALSSCRFLTLKNGAISCGGCGGKNDNDSIRALLLVTNPILHPGIIAKADVIKKLGYDKNFTCTEDMELWTRFVLSGHKIEILSEYLMIYRLHDKQITGTTLEKQKKEVLQIQKKYLSGVLAPMTSEQENYYINSIYFRNNSDVRSFCEFYKWAKKINLKKKIFDPISLNYAFFEILAEYKRKGLSKSDLLISMLAFDLGFLLKEIPNRKKRAKADGIKCIEQAKSIGLIHSGGNLEYPSFSKE